MKKRLFCPDSDGFLGCADLNDACLHKINFIKVCLKFILDFMSAVHCLTYFIFVGWHDYSTRKGDISIFSDDEDQDYDPEETLC